MHPLFLSDITLSKIDEGKGRDCYNISSMANSAILYFPMLLSLSLDNPILLPQLQDLLLSSKRQMHPLIRTNALIFIASNVSEE